MMGYLDGIGQWAATFPCADVCAGQTVKFGEDGSVLPCADGDRFCGVALSVGRDKQACSVALGGLVSARFSGSAPALGWRSLSADGCGGVKACPDGQDFLVVDVDSAASCLTLKL